MRRALSATELFAWCLESAGPFNLQAVVRLRGPLTAAAVEAAAAALARRQPLLAVRFSDPPGLAPAPAPLPVLRRDRGSTSSWAAVAAREVNRPLSADGPLARFLWLDGGGEHELILTAHHALCDGRSLTAVIGRLVADCARWSAGEPLDDRPLPRRRTLEERLGIEGPGSAVAARLARTVATSPLSGPPSPAATRVARREVDATALRELRDSAAAIDVDLSSLLLAALALSVAERGEPGIRVAEVDGLVSVDMRSHCVPAPDPSELGYLVSFLAVPCPVREIDRVATLAATLRSRLRAALAAGQPRRAIERLAAVLATADPRPPAERFRLRRPTAMVSNLGVLDLPTEIGPYRVEALRFATAATLFWAHRPSALLIASTFDRRLQLELVASSLAFAAAEVEELADAVVARLGPPSRS